MLKSFGVDGGADAKTLDDNKRAQIKGERRFPGLCCVDFWKLLHIFVEFVLYNQSEGVVNLTNQIQDEKRVVWLLLFSRAFHGRRIGRCAVFDALVICFNFLVSKTVLLSKQPIQLDLSLKVWKVLELEIDV